MSKKNFQILVLLAGLLACSSSQFVLSAEFRQSEVNECIQMLHSESSQERGAAGEKLSEMGPEAKTAVSALIEVLCLDPVMSVRGEAAKALGSIGPDAANAVPALIEFVKNRDGGIERAYAATALGHIGARSQIAVPVLIDIIENDEQPVVRQLSARALGDLGKNASSALPVLIQAIKKGDKDLRDAACDALCNIPALAANLPALTEMLSDEIKQARVAAAKSLAGAGSDAAVAVPELIKLLDDRDASVRLASVQALGAIGKSARSALSPLKAHAKDEALKSEVEKAIAGIKAAR